MNANYRGGGPTVGMLKRSRQLRAQSPAETGD
jgi:hypothetical protein